MSVIPRSFTILGAGHPAGGIMYGLNGQTITGNANGAWAITANGTNQNITLTPSGTGKVVVGGSAPTVQATGATFTIGTTSANNLVLVTNGTTVLTLDSSSNATLAGILTVNGASQSLFNRAGLATTSTSVVHLANTTAATGGATVQMSPRILFRGNAWDTAASQTVDFFIENLPTSAATPTGTLKFGYSLNGAAATYPLTLSSAGILTTTDTILCGADVRCAATARLYFNTRSMIYSTIDGNISLQNNANTGFTSLDYGPAGAATTSSRRQKSVTGIANATATDVLTVTIPNAAHSACLEVSLTGSLGAGGAIGANEASASIKYNVVITRTAGVATVATVSTAYGSAAAAVAGAATVTITAAASAMTGAVGATQTFTVQVTITRSGGSSTNHTCLVVAEVQNANATGITIA